MSWDFQFCRPYDCDRRTFGAFAIRSVNYAANSSKRLARLNRPDGGVVRHWVHRPTWLTSSRVRISSASTPVRPVVRQEVSCRQASELSARTCIRYCQPWGYLHYQHLEFFFRWAAEHHRRLHHRRHSSMVWSVKFLPLTSSSEIRQILDWRNTSWPIWPTDIIWWWSAGVLLSHGHSLANSAIDVKLFNHFCCCPKVVFWVFAPLATDDVISTVRQLNDTFSAADLILTSIFEQIINRCGFVVPYNGSLAAVFDLIR